MLSVVSCGLTTQVALIKALGQTQDPLWKRYMDAAEEFRAKGDFAKDGQYLDQAIVEIEKLAKQQPTPRLTETQRLNCHILVTTVANLAANQSFSLNEKRISSSKAVIGLPPSQDVGEIQKRLETLTDKSGKRDYEEICKAESIRFQRIESAFQHLFGSTAPETSYARTMLSALQQK